MVNVDSQRSTQLNSHSAATKGQERLGNETPWPCSAVTPSSHLLSHRSLSQFAFPSAKDKKNGPLATTCVFGYGASFPIRLRSARRTASCTRVAVASHRHGARVSVLSSFQRQQESPGDADCIAQQGAFARVSFLIIASFFGSKSGGYAINIRPKGTQSIERH